MPPGSLRLLSLDGGGVRGLSSLIILEKLMETVNEEAPPKPCEYFDMIGGTSTGGLIAIMLGRLKMSIDDCIEAYLSLSGRVFEKRAHRVKDIYGNLQGRFDSAELEGSVKAIIADHNLPVDALLKDVPEATCKVFVITTSKSTSDIACLTSYRSNYSREDLLDYVQIWEACRATSAATPFWDPIAIGPYGELFIDGATGANNPVQEVWNQAQTVWDSEPLEDQVQCLISIGTGVPSLQDFRNNVLGIGKTLAAIATATETTARKFLQDKQGIHSSKRYFRVNVAHGLENTGLEESKKRTEIAAATSRYLESKGVKQDMHDCANSLASERKSEAMQVRTPEVQEKTLESKPPSYLDTDTVSQIGETEQIHCGEQEPNVGYASSTDESDLRSVSSAPSIASSNTSAGSHHEVLHKASEQLVDGFIADIDVNDLYSAAVNKFEIGKFLKYHDQVLKRYFRAALSECHDNFESQAVKSISRGRQREEISRLIWSLQSDAKAQTLAELQEQRSNRAHVLENFFSAQSGQQPGTKGNSKQDTTKSVEKKADANKEDDWDDLHDVFDEEDGTHEEDNPHLSNELLEPLLPKMMKLFTEGRAFSRYKKDLRWFTNPPKTLKEALTFEDLELIENFLRKRFDSIAAEECPWLYELRDIGCAMDEIAALLLETSVDAPWIYFEPQNFPSAPIVEDFHLENCIHHIGIMENARHDTSTKPAPNVAHSQSLMIRPPAMSPKSHRDHDEVRTHIQELCGLAGITPRSRDPEDWVGQAWFANESSTSQISYTIEGNLEVSKIIFRLVSMLSVPPQGLYKHQAYVATAILSFSEAKPLRRDCQRGDQ